MFVYNVWNIGSHLETMKRANLGQNYEHTKEPTEGTWVHDDVTESLNQTLVLSSSRFLVM